MDAALFRAWLAGVDELTLEQRQEVHELLFGRPPEAEVVASIEDRMASERCCPHCGSNGVVKRGRANGLRRYRCKACGKSFNAYRHTLGSAAPQGVLAGIRRDAECGRHGARLGQPLRGGDDHGVSRAPSLPARGPDRHRALARHR